MTLSALPIIPGFAVAFSEVEMTFVRSSGPGGQNVNKVNTKARLRWNLFQSTSVPAHLMERLIQRLGPKLTLDGDLIVAADTYRDQPRNREECYEKFRQILADALRVQKKRKPTAPSRSSQRKSKEKKRQHAEKKASRRRIDF